jgi:hypothetical protein
MRACVLMCMDVCVCMWTWLLLTLLVTYKLSRTEVKLHITEVFFLCRKVLVNTGVVLVSSLAVYLDYLYWVDKGQRQIERGSKMDSSG